MNSVPNRDSEQCVESNLSRVYSANTLNQPACTLRPHCAQAARTTSIGRRVVAHRAPCRRPCPAVSWSCHWVHARAGAPCRSFWAYRVATSLAAIQKLYRDIEPLPCALSALCHACPSSLRRIVACCCIVS